MTALLQYNHLYTDGTRASDILKKDVPSSEIIQQNDLSVFHHIRLSVMRKLRRKHILTSN